MSPLFGLTYRLQSQGSCFHVRVTRNDERDERALALLFQLSHAARNRDRGGVDGGTARYSVARAGRDVSLPPGRPKAKLKSWRGVRMDKMPLLLLLLHFRVSFSHKARG